MKNKIQSPLFLLILFLCALMVSTAWPLALAAADWSKVEVVLGRKGAVSGDTIKFGFPRTDLHVLIGTVALKPTLALGSWVAFSGSEDSAMMMGDLVLLQQEVEPVMDQLQSGGVMITALHNHLLLERPHVMYMHYMGHGKAEELAKTFKAALEHSATPMKAPAAPAAEPKVRMSQSKIEEILGQHGTLKGGVLSFGVPRAEPIQENGTMLPPALGVANSINIQDSPKGIATTGDFVLIASEVNPVIHALRSHGIMVTALHNHMLQDNPRLFFMHFWGNGPAGEVAAGLKAALDDVHTKK
ncbi:MAG: DUF1259 domain-containing protein [Acidobacteriia bacterium]|nr:DUF1259 domain-containing protein [Terriglobia bacterium]